MIMPETVYIALIIFLFFSLLFVAYKLYKFSILILDLETTVEECLDILNVHYGKMNDVVQKPVFFDSVEVRQVINDIKQCHSAVLLIANKLTSDAGIESEIKKENSKENE